MTQEPVESWEKTGVELNALYEKDIWKSLPFTKGFIERHCDTQENAQHILKKIDEYHREVCTSLSASQKQKQIEEFMSMLEESYQDIQHKLAGGMAESSFGAEVIWEARMGRIKEFRDDILAKLKEGAPKK